VPKPVWPGTLAVAMAFLLVVEPPGVNEVMVVYSCGNAIELELGSSSKVGELYNTARTEVYTVDMSEIVIVVEEDDDLSVTRERENAMPE
jgi:hypothetical protein